MSKWTTFGLYGEPTDKQLYHIIPWPPDEADIVILKKAIQASGMYRAKRPELSPLDNSMFWWLTNCSCKPKSKFEREDADLHMLIDHAVYGQDTNGHGVIVSCPYISKSEFTAYLSAFRVLAPWLKITASEPWWLPQAKDMATITLRVEGCTIKNGDKPAYQLFQPKEGEKPTWWNWETEPKKEEEG